MKLALALVLVPSIASCTWIYSLTERFCDSCSIIETQYTSQEPIQLDIFRTSELDFCISGSPQLRCDYLEFIQDLGGLRVNLARNYIYSEDWYLPDESFFDGARLNSEGTYIQETGIGDRGADIRILSIIDPIAQVNITPEPNYLTWIGFVILILIGSIIKWRER